MYGTIIASGGTMDDVKGSDAMDTRRLKVMGVHQFDLQREKTLDPQRIVLLRGNVALLEGDVWRTIFLPVPKSPSL